MTLNGDPTQKVLTGGSGRASSKIKCAKKIVFIFWKGPHSSRGASMAHFAPVDKVLVAAARYYTGNQQTTVTMVTYLVAVPAPSRKD